MGALAPALPRLAKLLPLLGSNQDGERIATLYAIDRTLAGYQLGWHDLTAALVAAHDAPRAPPPPPPPPPYQPRETDPASIARQCLAVPSFFLNAWERNFCHDIASRAWGFGDTLSPKQAATLHRIHKKVQGL